MILLTDKGCVDAVELKLLLWSFNEGDPFETTIARILENIPLLENIAKEICIDPAHIPLFNLQRSMVKKALSDIPIERRIVTFWDFMKYSMRVDINRRSDYIYNSVVINVPVFLDFLKEYDTFKTQQAKT